LEAGVEATIAGYGQERRGVMDNPQLSYLESPYSSRGQVEGLLCQKSSESHAPSASPLRPDKLTCSYFFPKIPNKVLSRHYTVEVFISYAEQPRD